MFSKLLLLVPLFAALVVAAPAPSIMHRGVPLSRTHQIHSRVISPGRTSPTLLPSVTHLNGPSPTQSSSHNPDIGHTPPQVPGGPSVINLNPPVSSPPVIDLNPPAPSPPVIDLNPPVPSPPVINLNPPAPSPPVIDLDPPKHFPPVIELNPPAPSPPVINLNARAPYPPVINLNPPPPVIDLNPPPVIDLNPPVINL